LVRLGKKQGIFQFVLERDFGPLLATAEEEEEEEEEVE
jgi:hypothetical protein